MGNKKPYPPRPGQKRPIEDARTIQPAGNHIKIRLSFERYECGNAHCLSKCNEEQTVTFLDCLRKLSERTWQQLIDVSSKQKGMKTGLNSTLYQRTDLKNPDFWPAWLDSDTPMLGVRATERRRIFGVRHESVFYVVWFDEGHKIVEG